jgi:hypothetical protein
MFITCINHEILGNKGHISDLWYISLLYYLSILLVVTNHLFFITQYIIFLLPIVTFVSSFLLICFFLLLVHYGLLFDFNSKATIFSSLGNISFYLYLFFILGFNAIFDYCLKVRVFYFDNSLSCELEKSIIKEKRRKMSTKIKLTLKEKIGIKRSNSNFVEQSRLSLIKNNFNNIISQHDKISFFNKNNLSKMNDFKLSCLKKIDGQKHDNYLNINYNHPNDNSEYNEDKSDNEEDECDKE